MAEAGVFEPVCRRAAAPTSEAAAPLLALARTMHAQGLTPSYGPGDHGNLSCRWQRGCLVSARETSKASLRAEELVYADGYEQTPQGWRVTYEGWRPPSTDTLMHLRIYAQRPDVGAVVHGHDDAVLAQADALQLPVTQVSAKTNSHALIDEVVALAAAHDYVVLREHGVLALGRTIEEAAARLQDWYHRARPDAITA